MPCLCHDLCVRVYVFNKAFILFVFAIDAHEFSFVQRLESWKQRVFRGFLQANGRCLRCAVAPSREQRLFIRQSTESTHSQLVAT